MNDQMLISQMNDLMKMAAKSSVQDENNERQYLEQMFILHDRLSLKSKKLVKNQLYIPHRNLGRLYFLSNQFEKALYHLEKAKKLSGFKSEEFVNKCNLDRLIVNSKIIMGLKTDSKEHLKDARDINSSLLIKKNKIHSQSLKDEIDSDKLILDSIDAGDVKTIIEFEIPSPIPVKDKTPIEFTIDNIDYILNIDIIENPSAMVTSIGGGFVEIIEDKFGLVNRSKISLTIFRYIDPNETTEIKTFSEKKQLLKTLSEAIIALNYFIERYRIITGKYWIETIFYKMIKEFSCKIMAGDQIIRNLPSNIDHLICSSPKISWLTDDKNENLKKSLENDEIPLWEILLLDAKDFLLRRNYRESIYAINGAFENYLMLKAREKLGIHWGEEETNDYLEGLPVYEYHNLKDYMDEESFNKAIEDGKLNAYVPPTNQILKQCYLVDPCTISRTQLNRLVHKIRRKRNDVMHGVDISEDLEIIAFEAIKSFEDFITVFN